MRVNYWNTYAAIHGQTTDAAEHSESNTDEPLVCEVLSVYQHVGVTAKRGGLS
jgi:hypothetical protein